jgi:pseudaminic acid synthase
MMDIGLNLEIAGRKIGPSHPPYVIAEVSANHNGQIDNAFKLIDIAKQSGADAVKLQSYKPDTITLNSQGPDFQIKGGLWDGRTLYELYQEAHMPWEWHAPLFEYANSIGITIFSTPFDFTAVDMLVSLKAPAFKIASFEVIDIPLIRYVARQGKPMIISTGMADEGEIAEAIDAARAGGCEEIAVLHCVSGYPAPASDYNLRTISDMQKRYGVVTGLSDHTIENATAIASIALGASIVEKHFTLNRSGGGPDDSFSLEPAELKSLCSDLKTAWSALGQTDYGLKSSERGNRQFRRSLYFVSSLKTGQIITANDVRSVRPGFGIAPKHIEQIIGSEAKRDIVANSPVLPSDLNSR